MGNKNIDKILIKLLEIQEKCKLKRERDLN
jgi:hypothetical protein